MARKFLTPVGLPAGATLPATGAAGELFYLTTDTRVYQYNGAAWVAIAGLPVGGTTGQFLAKVDNTDYSATWTSSAPTAGYTSVVKHEVKLGEAIAKGQAVYVSSADGTNMVVSKASNATEATSSKTIGLLETGGSTNAKVNVVTEGLLSGLNTGAAAAGDPVWLGTSGDLIFGLVNKPVAPAHLVFIGVVTRANSSTGEIFVKPQNGFELRELHTVLLEADASIADNEVLAYDTASSLWKNQTASEAGLAALSGAAFTGNVSSTGKLSAGGNLESTNSSGDEGGEIFLSKAVTNTTLTGGVTIDVFQNKLRFFEQGGNARGYYIDITTGGDGVGTNLVGSGGGGSGTVTSIATTSPLTGGTITTTGTIGINASSSNTANYVVQRDASGNFAAGTITATFSGSGAALTSLPAANVTGTLTSTVLGNSAVFIGTTSVALNRTTANLALTGITSVAFPGSSSGTATLQANATAGTTTITLPATTGTLALTSQLPTVNDATLTLAVSGVGLSGSQTFTANQGTAATFTVTSNATDANTVSTIVARNASGNFSAGTITATLTGNASGLSAGATGSIPYQSATSTTTFLAAPATTNSFLVYNTGTGAPEWDTPSAAMAAMTGYTSTATAGGTTTLTAASSYYQLFTGSSNQNVQLPVTSTLQLGWTYHVVNNSTGVLTLRASDSGTLIGIPAGTTAMATCINVVSTGITAWEFGLTDFSGYTGSGSVVLDTSPTLSGTPLAPTAAANTNSLQIATTAFVATAVNAVSAPNYTYLANTFK